MYINSDRHRDNLKLAREKLATLTVECSTCKKYIHKAGIKAHTKSCLKGKSCPVCGTWFSRKSTTCSHGCSNTYFRSNVDHPGWKEEAYRSTCFAYHKKVCVICGEDKIVEVHHLDEDKSNNQPSNLIPLCPTHHQYWHSRYQGLVRGKIENYIREWRNGSV